MRLNSRTLAEPACSDAAFFDSATSIPRWFTPEALRPIHEVNLHMLTLLRSQVSRLRGPESLSKHLAELPQDAVERIAHSPCLLLDVAFCDERWQHYAQNSTRHCLNYDRRSPANPAVMALAQSALCAAWHFVRVYPDAAEFVIGTTSASTRALAALSLLQLYQIAISNDAWIVPRWSSRPVCWEQLIAVSRTTAAPSAASLKVMQLVLGQRR